MAEISRTRVSHDANSTTYKWEGVASGDTCTAVVTRDAQEVSVSINGGTIGSMSVALHGTLDEDYVSPTGFAALRDLAGTTIALTTAGPPVASRTNCYQMKPIISGAGGSGVDIYMMVRHT